MYMGRLEVLVVHDDKLQSMLSNILATAIKQPLSVNYSCLSLTNTN